jgi:hypothetical protein
MADWEGGIHLYHLRILGDVPAQGKSGHLVGSLGQAYARKKEKRHIHQQNRISFHIHSFFLPPIMGSSNISPTNSFYRIPFARSTIMPQKFPMFPANTFVHERSLQEKRGICRG